ncbi:MAG: glycosyltransferase family 4 protein [Candidatus Omnitrophica bacterium]|nr:glycosyltransferase family 4 protein [Candidatus Omnitrophota bacterium]
MKILIMNWRDIKNPRAGGAEVVIHENARAWVQAGHEVAVLTANFPGGSALEIIDGVTIYRIGGVYSVYWKAVRFYKSQLQGKYDIVLDAINTIPFFTPLYVKEPVVSLIFQFTKEVYFSVFPKLIAVIPYLLEPLLFQVYKKHPVVVLSPSIRDELVGSGFALDKIHIVEPGIHLSSVHRRNIKAAKPLIVYLNRIISYKNPHHLLLALPKIQKIIPDTRVVITGFRANQSYEKTVKKLITQLHLEESVTTYGFIDGKKKAELLEDAWVHVLPSIREGWGISVIEAAAYGTCSVGYDVVGLRDSIQHEKTGRLVAAGDIDALAEAIVTILRDTSLRQTYDRNALAYASTFDWPVKARQFLAILQSYSAQPH